MHGLRLAISLGIKRLLIYGDSLLVVQQVNKEWDINKNTMDTYIMEIRKLKKKFSRLEIHHVVHDNNVGADVLSKLGSDRANVPLEISFMSCITLPSGHQTQVPSLRVPRNPTERS
jgi:ribonuclease HI